MSASQQLLSKRSSQPVYGERVLEPGPLLYPRELSAVSFLGHVPGAETVKEPAAPLFWVGAECGGEEAALTLSLALCGQVGRVPWLCGKAGLSWGNCLQVFATFSFAPDLQGEVSRLPAWPSGP